MKSAPDGFETVFTELRKFHEEVCMKLTQQLPIFEDMLLEAHRRELDGPCQSLDKSLEKSLNQNDMELDGPCQSNDMEDPFVQDFGDVMCERSSPIPIRRLPSVTSAECGLVSMTASFVSAETEGVCSMFSCGDHDQITARWLILVSSLLSQPQHPFHQVSLRDAWSARVQTTIKDSLKRSTASSLKIKRLASGNLEAGAQIRGRSCFQKLVIHPDGMLAKWFMFMGSLALGYDLITVPVIMAFQMDIEGVLFELYLARTIFWTLDMIVSSLTGYYENVVMEMRPTRVMLKYLRTWFLLDFLINTSDWITILLSHYDVGLSKRHTFLGGIRVFKYFRFLRILRAFRVFKSAGTLSSYVDRLTTEVMRGILKLLCMILIIFLVNHYLACAWYALAEYNSVDHQTWIQALHLENPDSSYLYVIAMHWAMTQFTPATNNVNPANLRERVFAFFVVVFALLMFSSFLGGLANTVSEIKKLHIAKYQEELQIRRFIFARQVKTKCAHAIWNFYRIHKKSASTIMCCNDIPFLAKLPKTILLKLYDDVFIPIMMKHPAFNEVNKIEHDVLVMACFEASAEMSWSPEQEIFSEGSYADDMFIVNSGSVTYNSDAYGVPHILGATQIISEVGLWADWRHMGVLSAADMCHAVKLNATRFEKVIRANGSAELKSCLQAYAMEFVQFFNQSCQCQIPFTDIVPTALSPMFSAQMTTITAQVFASGLELGKMHVGWLRAGSLPSSYSSELESGQKCRKAQRLFRLGSFKPV